MRPPLVLLPMLALGVIGAALLWGRRAVVPAGAGVEPGRDVPSAEKLDAAGFETLDLHAEGPEAAPGLDSTSGARRLRAASFVQGRVLAEETRVPIAGAELVLMDGRAAVARTESGANGGFAFPAGALGTHLAVAPPAGWTVRQREQALSGAERAGESGVRIFLRTWPPPVAGDISGELRSESGPWTTASVPPMDHVILDLVSLGEPRIERRAVISLREQAQGGVALVFRVADVPEGEYELTLSSLGSQRWTPSSLRVRPPASGLEFLRYDVERGLPVTFEVVDAETGEPIEEYQCAHIQMTVSEENGVFLHAGNLAEQRFPAGSRFDWSLWAEDYAPHFGSERDLELSRERWFARIALERGWSARIVVMGPNPTIVPLAGVGIRFDGEDVGRTDARGSLVVRLAQEPAELAVDHHGWELAENPLSRGRRANAERRGHVLPVLLRPPRQ